MNNNRAILLILMGCFLLACGKDDATPPETNLDRTEPASAVPAGTIATVFGKPISRDVFEAYRATLSQSEGAVDDTRRQQQLAQFLDLLVISGAEPGPLPATAGELSGIDLELAQLFAGVQEAVTAWQVANPVEDSAVRTRYDAVANAAIVRDYKLRHLNVADLAAAASLQAALDQGQSFTRLEAGLIETEGATSAGDLGWVPTDALTEPVVNSIESASDLGITLPIETEDGAHIFLVEAARDIAPPKYEDIAEELRGSIAQQRFFEYVSERRAAAQIETFDES